MTLTFTLEQVVLLIIGIFILANILPRIKKPRVALGKKNEHKKSKTIVIDGKVYKEVEEQPRKSDSRRGIYRYL